MDSLSLSLVFLVIPVERSIGFPLLFSRTSCLSCVLTQGCKDPSSPILQPFSSLKPSVFRASASEVLDATSFSLTARVRLFCYFVNTKPARRSLLDENFAHVSFFLDPVCFQREREKRKSDFCLESNVKREEKGKEKEERSKENRKRKKSREKIREKRTRDTVSFRSDKSHILSHTQVFSSFKITEKYLSNSKCRYKSK